MAEEVSFKRKRAPKGNRSQKKAKTVDSEDSGEEEEQGVSVQPTNLRRKNNPLLVSSRKSAQEERESFSYESDRKIAPHGPADQGATLQFELETEEEREKALQKKKEQQSSLPTEVGDGGGKVMKVYRGIANYRKYHSESRDVPKAMRSGPVRPSGTNVRAVTPMDYQPDICKDYKETGFCGYGDNCIYMHDRGDYKSGWQLERDWNEAQKNNRKFGEQEDFTVKSDDEEDSDDELPFACSLCRGDFVDPVRTLCNHYFCENCILKKSKRNRCFICGENTKGILNSAPKLIAKLKKRKELQKERNEEEEAPVDNDE